MLPPVTGVSALRVSFTYWRVGPPPAAPLSLSVAWPQPEATTPAISRSAALRRRRPRGECRGSFAMSRLSFWSVRQHAAWPIQTGRIPVVGHGPPDVREPAAEGSNLLGEARNRLLRQRGPRFRPPAPLPSAAMARVVAVANQKGGVAKTTTV